MGITYVAGSQMTGNRGYQVAENASPPVAAATANHWVLWSNSSGLQELDDAGNSRTFVYDAATQTLSNKTLTTPVIGSFVNATHDHQSNAGGGSLSAAAIGSGTLALARGGSGADLSATGGANRVVMQESTGAVFTVRVLTTADITSGVFANARIAWDAPAAIGTTTPAAATFNALNVNANTASLVLYGAAGNVRGIRFQSGFNTAASNRWLVYTSGTTESGSNAGSDLRIQRYDDSGVALGEPMVITRSSGDVAFSNIVSIGSYLDHNGTRVGLYGVDPVVQWTTTGTSTGFTAGGGTTATHLSTFTGNNGTKAYTVGDIVAALKAIGIMAIS